MSMLIFTATSGNVATTKLGERVAGRAVADVLWNMPPSDTDVREHDERFKQIFPSLNVLLSKVIEDEAVRLATKKEFLEGPK